MKIYKTLLILALPMMMQNLLHSSLIFLDTFMIGRLGDQAIASMGIAGQLMFIFFLVQFGIHSGISVHTSQYWGRKEISRIQNLLGIQLMLGLISIIIFLFIIYVIPGKFVSLYTDDPYVAADALSYMNIVGFSLIFTVLIYSFTYNLRSTEIVRAPLYASGVSVLINMILNYLLIFGKYGFPELGVKGAAWGTAISRIVECFILVMTVYVKKYPAAAKLREMFSFSRSFLKGILKVSWPVFSINILNYLFSSHNISYCSYINYQA